MTKALIVPDLAYTSRAGRRGGRSNGYKELTAKLKYYQYRNDRNGHIPQAEGLERWQDHGLGRHFRDIMKSCDTLGSDKVLAWTWVISPAPDLMALVPETERGALIRSLTEHIVEAYYEARDVDVPAYSYVVHDRLTKPDEKTGERLQQLHSHIVLPGTVPSFVGTREPFYNRANKGHIALLQEIATECFSVELDRLVGPEWRELRPELAPPPLEPEIIDLPAIPTLAEGESELDQWFGRRRSDLDV